MQAKTKNFLKLNLVVATLIGLSALSGTAYAGTATSNLPVSATVSANCTIDASSGVSFGAYDPVVTNASTGADLTATGTISTTCTNGASVTVTLGQGSNADTGSTDAAPLRRMLANTSDYLSYQLYTDSAHTTVWDNTTGASVTGTGAAVSTTVYGLVTKGQNVPSGNYSDTVVATVTF
ncbi:spore coat U domain-containing protein [Fulvimonas yonginensis]|uniref:Spore coat U domain-containing protein n=1 Tax=Fulvimonas yonginensis TaxID=1495200 RepID=A0ABU8JDG7_9GAMM